MALDITEVQAGELITATRVNELIRELEKLDVRVTKLEETGVTTGAVEITAVSPTTVRVGDLITIVGRNFQYLIGGSRVRFNGIPPEDFEPESSDSLIICEVPPMNVVIPDDGLDVTLTVSNTTTTASREITVLPEPVEQSGNIVVTFGSVAPDPVLSDRNADFEFILVSGASLPATLLVTPRVVGPSGAPLGWATKVLNASKTEIGNRQVTIRPAETIAIFVQVAIPEGSNGDEFTVEVDMAGSGLTATGDASLTVGQASNLDATITKLGGAGVSPPSASLVAGVLTVPADIVANVGMEADFTVAGEYIVTISMPGTEGWTAESTDPAPDLETGIATKFVTEADIRNGGGTANEALEFAVVPTSGAPPGHLVLTVQRKNQANRRVATFDLRRKVGG